MELEIWVMNDDVSGARPGRHVMAKDGPPISSGYRFGGGAAFQSWLPSSAISPRTDLKNGETLAAFNDYYGRAKGIGQSVPETQGVSPQRAAVLQKIQQLKEEKPSQRRVTLEDTPGRKLELVHDGRYFYFVEKDKRRDTVRVSHLYGSRGRAMQAYCGWIWWYRPPRPA
jgi:hypothetical protein